MSHRGLRRVASFRPFRSESKSETQGQLSRRGGGTCSAFGLLLSELAGQSKLYKPRVWDWTRAAEFQWDLCPQELGSATNECDGRTPAALRKLLARDTTGGATEAVSARYDWRRYRSC